MPPRGLPGASSGALYDQGAMTASIWDGIVIGGAGGAIAGITLYLIQFTHQKVIDHRDAKRICKWLEENSPIGKGRKYRSTRAIAGYNNLTEDRVRYLCSHRKNNHLSTGEKEDLWSIHARET